MYRLAILLVVTSAIGCMGYKREMAEASMSYYAYQERMAFAELEDAILSESTMPTKRVIVLLKAYDERMKVLATEWGKAMIRVEKGGPN